MTLPNSPTPGTGVSYPLVTPEQYAALTGDTDSEEHAVEEALADAVQEISIACNRTIPWGQYTENQYLYARGMVYPSANPIDPTQIITAGEEIYDPSNLGDGQGSASVIQGDGIWVGWFTPLPFMPIWTGVFDAQTVITYWGGYFPYQYEPGSGDPPMSTQTLPRGKALLIAKYAYYALHPVALVGVPAGVKSVSVGGVSMSGELSAFQTGDPAMWRAIKRWRNPQAHPWDNTQVLPQNANL